MPANIGQFGLNVAEGVVNTGMGLLLQNQADSRQLRQQQGLQDLQIQGNKAMVDYNYGKQLQMWKDTNYKAQMEQLTKAGLNPGLMYGMSGGGATTTGQATGTVQGTDAPKGGQEIQTMMQLGIQRELLQAQKENIEADTANKKATTPKIETETKSLSQGIENQKAQQKLTEIETNLKQIEEQVKGKTIEAQQDLLVNAAAQGVETIDILHQQLLLDRAQRMDKVQLLQTEVAGAIIRNALTQANIQLTQKQTSQIATQLAQTWSNLDRQERELKLKAWEADVKAKYPGLWNVMGRVINETAEGMGRIFGQKGVVYDKPKTDK